MPIPDHMWPPEFLPGVAAWYEAFWDLSTDRQVGMGVGPIPGSAVRAYCHGWPDAEVFIHCMQAMDGAFLEHAAKEREKAAKKG